VGVSGVSFEGIPVRSAVRRKWLLGAGLSLSGSNVRAVLGGFEWRNTENSGTDGRPSTSDPESLAEVTCTECGRRPLPGERWSLRFTDLREVAIYCPSCDNREFGLESFNG
jgi:hypothetical protein